MTAQCPMYYICKKKLQTINVKNKIFRKRQDIIKSGK